jgi:hypothetical protein
MLFSRAMPRTVNNDDLRHGAAVFGAAADVPPAMMGALA